MGSKNGQELKPTSGKDWRTSRENGVLVTFRSGNTARIRPINIDFLVSTGKIPTILESHVVDLIERGTTTMPGATTLEDEKTWFEFLNDLCRYAFVEPRVVDDPKEEGEIGVWDIDLADKNQLWAMLGTPARLLAEQFRLQKDAVASLAADEARPSASLGDPENRGVGQSDLARIGVADGADV